MDYVKGYPTTRSAPSDHRVNSRCHLRSEMSIFRCFSRSKIQPPWALMGWTWVQRRDVSERSNKLVIAGNWRFLPSSFFTWERGIAEVFLLYCRYIGPVFATIPSRIA